MTSHLVPPHGGRLVDLMASPERVAEPRQLMVEFLSDVDVSTYLGANEYDGVVWFNRERMEDLVWWIYATGIIAILVASSDPKTRAGWILDLHEAIDRISDAVAHSLYQVDRLLDALDEKRTTRKGAPRE